VTSELLGFLASRVGNEKTLVVLNKQLLEFSLLGLIVVLLVEGDDGLGNGQTDGHDLGGGTTTSDANADVKVLEAVSTKEQDGLESLEAKGSGLEELEGLSVNLDEASALGSVGNSGGVLLSSKALNLLDFVVDSHLSLSLIVL
jgi:hypothetical protein